MVRDKGELERMVDLVMAGGVEFNESQEVMEKVVMKAWIDRGGDREVEVVIDERRDHVMLMKGNTDIMPKDFESEAVALARKSLLELMEKRPDLRKREVREISRIANTMENNLIAIPWSGVLSIFFWFYHLYFLLYVLILPWNFVMQVVTMNEKWEYLLNFNGLMMLILVLTPIFVMLSVRILKLKDWSLMKVILWWEVPWIFISYLMLVVFPDPIAIIKVFAITSLVMIAFNYWKNDLGLISKLAEKQKTALNVVLFTLATVVFGYIAILIVFFIPGVLIAMGREFFSALMQDMGGYGIESLMGSMVFKSFQLGFFGLLILLVIGVMIAPVILTRVLITKTTGELIKLAIFGDQFRKTIIGVTIGLVLILVFVVTYQPDYRGLRKNVDAFIQGTTYEQKAEAASKLAGKEIELRQAIRDSMQLRNRYFWTSQDDVLTEFYEDIVPDIGRGNLVVEVGNNIFMVLAPPFIYRGPINDNGGWARGFKDLYGYDYNSDGIETSVKPNVNLVNRKIDALVQDKNWVVVNVEDEFQNKGNIQQEVVYEFSLPEGAVIMDLKLGDALQYSGIVAPKGAARATYEQQIQKRRDPALLEQVGLRQYRLRVFPVPAKNDSSTLDGRNQRVMFSYVVPLMGGEVGLPVYSIQRNVDLLKTNIVGVVDGRSVSLGLKDRVLELPEVVADCKSWEENIGLWEDQTTKLTARIGSIDKLQSELGMMTCVDGKWSSANSMEGKRIAILFDTSWSNRDNELVDQLKKVLRSNDNWIDQNEVMWFGFNSLISEGKRLDSSSDDQILNINYFGDKDVSKVLGKFNSRDYDWVIVMTNEKNWEVSEGMLPNWDGARLDFVHANGKIPNYNNELVRFILKNKGMAFGSIDEAVENFKLVSGLRNIYTNVLLIGNSFVEIDQEPDWETWVINDKLLAQLSMNLNNNSSELSLSKRWAVNVYLNGLFGESNGNVTTLNSWLDKLNVFANQARVVTPFSSMVALVNFQQLNELKNNIQSNWRYLEDFGNPVSMPIQMPIINPDFEFNQWGSARGDGSLNITIPNGVDMFRPSNSAPLGTIGGMPSGMVNSSLDDISVGKGFMSVGLDMNLLILVIPVVLLVILAAIKWIKERRKI